jgi:hypothetical protein
MKRIEADANAVNIWVTTRAMEKDKDMEGKI